MPWMGERGPTPEEDMQWRKCSCDWPHSVMNTIWEWGEAEETVMFTKVIDKTLYIWDSLCVYVTERVCIHSVSHLQGESFWGYVMHFVCMSSPWMPCQIQIQISNENTAIVTECPVHHPACVWKVLSCQNPVSKLPLWWLTIRLITQWSRTNYCVWSCSIWTMTYFCVYIWRSYWHIYLGFVTVPPISAS